MNPKTYAAFTKATGIKVKKSFYDSNETLHAKLKAGARGYDLVCPTGYMTKQLIAEKLLEPLDWSKLPNVKKNIDPKFHNTPDDPKSTYSVVKDWGTTGFMYRTDKIKERPTTWREFVALTKKYGEDDDGRQLARGRRLDRDDARLLVQHRGQEGARRGQEGAARAEAVHRGAPLVELRHADREGQGVDGPRLERRRPPLASKVPAKYVVAKEGGEIWIDYYNIPVGAKNPDAAHAWINFVYQPKNNGARDVVHVLRVAAQAVAAQGRPLQGSC